MHFQSKDLPWPSNSFLLRLHKACRFEPAISRRFGKELAVKHGLADGDEIVCGG